jgi:hypothetical protein
MDPSQLGVIVIISDIIMIRDSLLRGRGGSNDS